MSLLTDTWQALRCSARLLAFENLLHSWEATQSMLLALRELILLAAELDFPIKFIDNVFFGIGRCTLQDHR